MMKTGAIILNVAIAVTFFGSIVFETPVYATYSVYESPTAVLTASPHNAPAPPPTGEDPWKNTTFVPKGTNVTFTATNMEDKDFYLIPYNDGVRSTKWEIDDSFTPVYDASSVSHDFDTLGVYHVTLYLEDSELISKNPDSYRYPAPYMADDDRGGVGYTVYVVETTFSEDWAQQFGFDDYSITPNRYKSVRTGYTDTAFATTVPSITDFIHYKSTDTAEATVPEGPILWSLPIQVTGVLFAPRGESTIQANCISLNGFTTGSMIAKVYKPLTKTVAIRLVNQGNDDVQTIAVNNGKANAPCVNVGADGVCNTVAGGDDVQLIAFGGNSAANAPCVDTGANGVCNTSAGGDDTQVIAVGNGQPNQTCILPGWNGFIDTVAGNYDVGGYGIDDTKITTGTDGICNSSATTTSYASTDVSDSDVSYCLNNRVYNQAACCWTVHRLAPMTVNFDLDGDFTIDIGGDWMNAEESVVRNRCKDTAYDYNVFLVDNPSQLSASGLSGFGQRYAFVFEGGATTVAHELGHAAFSLYHASGLGFSINIMTQGPQEKWRLFVGQWDAIQSGNP